MKNKNLYFNYFSIGIFITLIITAIFVFIVFQLNYLGDNEVFESNGVKIIKISKNSFYSFESVNKYLKNYYYYSLNINNEDKFIDNHEKFKLSSLKESKVYQVNSKGPIYKKDDECTYYTCFDLFQCQTHENLIKIFIYPIRNYVINQNKSIEILNEFSEQFYQILETIIDSPFYTDDPNKACLFFIPIDTLNDFSHKNLTQVSQIFQHFEFFNKNDGRNHLFFNFLPSDNHVTKLDSGKAIIAGSNFNSFKYRQKFDISLPTYSLLSEEITNSNQIDKILEKFLSEKRKFNLLVAQTKFIEKSQIFKTLNNFTSKKVLLLNKCENELCSLNNEKRFNYSEVLTKSEFCLITKSSSLLSDSLMYGCIPIIIIDDIILPFSEKIDWTRFSFKFKEDQLKNFLQEINEINKERIYEMRKQALLIWKNYFSTIDRITITTLFILNERLFPHTALPKENWNQLSSKNLNSQFYYNSLDIISKSSNFYSITSKQGFTAVILTYDRLESLLIVIRQLLLVPSCVKILIVWNNQEKKPPNQKDFFNLINENWSNQIKIPINIVVTLENKLSNRFYPFHEIETDCVLAIDDDIIMLTTDELEFAYHSWREFPDRIVGFPSRVHKWDKNLNKWKYESEWTNEVSMILTGAAFYHKYYNFLYTFEMPFEIRNWVDKNMNCEDIAMNFLITNITGKAPVKTTPRKKFKCPECINKPMLSSNALSHLNKRSDCINYFAKIYGKMPLVTVEFRADPVLFQDNLPEKLKKFNQVGNL